MGYVIRLAMIGLMLAAVGCDDSGAARAPAPTTRSTTQKTATPKAAPNPLIVDVRTAGEYGGGHVVGAVNLPYDTIGQTIGRHAPDISRRIVLYCRSGRRAGRALTTLKRMGYLHVTNAGTVQNMIDTGYTVR